MPKDRWRQPGTRAAWPAGLDPSLYHFEHSPCYGKDQAYQSLTDGHVKYIWRSQIGTELLFDLDKDPQELHNLAANATSRELLNQWRGRLIQRLAQRPEGFSDGKKLIPGRPYPPLQARAK